MNSWVILDSLYLNVKYPREDVFKRWYRVIDGADFRVVSRGIVDGEFLVQGGASGYRVSVRRGDARAFLTDRVDENIGDRQGMGIWLQLGPKFLMDSRWQLKDDVKDFLMGIGVKKDWPITVNRIDLAVDLAGISMANQDLRLWRNGWVGRSRMSSNYYGESGQVETINIGSRKSAIYLRIYDKVAQAKNDGDLGYWREVWGGYEGEVTRVEWEVKPKAGGFEELIDFDGFAEWWLVKLANYLTNWGRLCVPNPNESNNRRWELSGFWQSVQEAIEEWAAGIDWPSTRNHDRRFDVSERYLRFLEGAISGGMARLSPNRPGIFSLLEQLEEYGIRLDDLETAAREKAEIYKRLNGTG